MSAPLEAVIGLEVHVQLRTDEKIFCADSTSFGAAPNTRTCPVCLGLPGALPVLNPEAVDLAVRTALGLGCAVHERSVFARKNYFYPDLPKGYQISQFDQPLATAGHFRFPMGEGGTGEVRIRRLHLEEDAGKSIHDRFPGRTAVDLNRAGVPLVEIVTEPDLRSPSAARACLTALKQLLEYLEVSDCVMEEGSLRVDANVSVREPGADRLGTKTELKNLNSFSGVERALEVEIERQAALVSAGEAVRHETLLWDEGGRTVRPMRGKEESHDYRYFPEPDLPPLRIERERVEAIARMLPELPGARRERFVRELGLPAYDAGVLTRDRTTADWFEAVVAGGAEPKVASNWVMGPVLRVTGERGVSLAALPVAPGALVELIHLVEEGTLSGSAGERVLDRMVEAGGSPAEIVEREGLAQVRDEDRLVAWVEEAWSAHPEEVARLRGGEERLVGFLVGEVMRASRGRADPRRVNALVRERAGL